MSAAKTLFPPKSAFLATPVGVWLVVVAWGVAHMLLRAVSSPVLGTDDMFENILVQQLSAGYMLRQPPLYEWLLWTVQQAMGPTVWSFLALKYGLISLAALFLFLIARRAVADDRLAALCVFSYSLFYQFGWNLHEGVTHTVVLVVACSATAYTFLRALEGHTLGRYAVFGVAVGAGLLAKHSYPLFLLALIMACLFDREWRCHLRFSGVILAAGVAALLYSPYLVWIITQGLPLIGDAAMTMGVEGNASHLFRSASGLGKLVFALAGFSVPLVPVVIFLFWQRFAGRLTPRTPDVSKAARLCGRTVAIMVGLTAILIVVTGATYVKERHMHPLLLLLPIWLFADLARFEAGRRWRWLAVFVIGFAAVSFVARVPGIVAPDRVMCGGKCRHMKPYEGIRAGLSRMGAAEATLVAADDYTGGNLRVLFPKARILSPRGMTVHGQPDVCLYVWEAGDAEPEESAGKAFAARLERSSPPEQTGKYLSAVWPHLWKPEGWRTTWWGVQPLPVNDPLCQ